MKFLITGAYGFVGSNLCKYLVEKGHACDALDIPAAKREGVPYSHAYAWEDIEPCRGGEVEKGKLNLVDYDCVVHLAGKAHDLKKVASEQSYFDINVGLTQKIFGALCQQVEPCRGGEDEKGKVAFVYFSSSKASAGGNAYGRSKLAAEKWLQEQSLTTNNQQLTTIILRPAMIHGPGNKGNLNLLWGVAKRGIPWPLAAFENKRSFTSIGNICAAVEALAEKGANGVYPIADDEMLSTNRLIELIAEACGKRAKLWRIPKGLMTFAAKIGDALHLPLTTERLGKLTEDSFVDNAALKQALGWTKMPIAAEDGMCKTLASFH